MTIARKISTDALKPLLLMCLVLFLASCAHRGGAHVSDDATWITLGTAGGPPLHAGEAQISNALVINGTIYLFDVGNGVLRQLDAAGLNPRDIKTVFVSHHHIDHVGDLGLTIFQHWLNEPNEKLLVVGPAGIEQFAASLEATYAPSALASFPVSGPPRPALANSIAVSELSRMAEPRVIYEDDNIRVSAIDVDHFQVPPANPLPEMPRAIAFRVDAGGRSIVYSGDTGPSENLVKLALNADLLVSEIVSLDGVERYLRDSIPNAPEGLVSALVDNMSKNHLTPEAVGRAAKAANVKEVVLTHYVPSRDTQPDQKEFVKGVTSEFNGTVRLANDLDRF